MKPRALKKGDRAVREDGTIVTVDEVFDDVDGYEVSWVQEVVTVKHVPVFTHVARHELRALPRRKPSKGTR